MANQDDTNYAQDHATNPCNICDAAPSVKCDHDEDLGSYLPTSDLVFRTSISPATRCQSLHETRNRRLLTFAYRASFGVAVASVSVHIAMVERDIGILYLSPIPLARIHAVSTCLTRRNSAIIWSAMASKIKWSGLVNRSALSDFQPDLCVKRKSGWWDVMYNTKDGWVIKSPLYWQTLQDSHRVIVGHVSRDIARIRAEELIRAYET